VQSIYKGKKKKDSDKYIRCKTYINDNYSTLCICHVCNNLLKTSLHNCQLDGQTKELFNICKACIKVTSVKFKNLHLSHTRDNIKDFVKNKGGVYKIEHIYSKKSYIGMAGINKLHERLERHLGITRKIGLGNKNLIKDINRYGIEEFSYELLYAVHITNISHISKKVNKRVANWLESEGEIKDLLSHVEKKWIQSEQPIYNERLKRNNASLKGMRRDYKNIEIGYYEKLELKKIFNSIKEVAVYFNCHESTVRRAIRKQSLFQKKGRLFVLKEE